MPKYHFVLLSFCLLLTASCAKKADVVGMFEEGFRLIDQEESNTFEAEKGKTIIRAALEQLILHPEFAAKIKKVFEKHVDKDPISRYGDWDILQKSLDDSLIHCKNTAVFDAAWKVRLEIIEQKQKAIVESVNNLMPKLNTFHEQINGIEASNIQFFDAFKKIEKPYADENIRETILALLYEVDTETQSMRESKNPLEKLREKVTAIAKLLNDKRTNALQSLLKRLDTEKQKDNDSETPLLDPKKKDGTADEWLSGAYQKIAEDAASFSEASDHSAVDRWTFFLPDVSTQNQLGVILIEAKRLQHIRYNLWVTAWLFHGMSFEDFVLINPDLLVPTVAAKYLEEQDKHLKVGEVEAYVRESRIRQLLRTPKVGLHAF